MRCVTHQLRANRSGTASPQSSVGIVVVPADFDADAYQSRYQTGLDQKLSSGLKVVDGAQSTGLQWKTGFYEIPSPEDYVSIQTPGGREISLLRKDDYPRLPDIDFEAPLIDQVFMVYDTETSGFLDPDKNDDGVAGEIIQFSGIRVRYNQIAQRWEEMDRMMFMVRPTRKDIDGKPYVGKTELHGITQEDASFAQFGPPELAFSVQNYSHGTVPVAHKGLSFDEPFIRETARMTMQVPTLDTLPLIQYAHPEWEHHKMSDMCQAYGIVNQAAHDALGDTVALAQALPHVLSQTGIHRVDQVYSMSDGHHPKWGMQYPTNMRKATLADTIRLRNKTKNVDTPWGSYEERGRFGSAGVPLPGDTICKVGRRWTILKRSWSPGDTPKPPPPWEYRSSRADRQDDEYIDQGVVAKEWRATFNETIPAGMWTSETEEGNQP